MNTFASETLAIVTVSLIREWPPMRLSQQFRCALHAERKLFPCADRFSQFLVAFILVIVLEKQSNWIKIYKYDVAATQ